jgi:hypothetical protein
MLKYNMDVDNSPLGAEYFSILPASVLMDFGGGDMSGAYERAGAMEAAAADRAAQTELEMFNRAAGYMAPWREAGGAAVGQVGSMLGLPGYPTVDPSAQLAATPGYKFAQQQGVSALDRSAASKGMALSGAQQKGLTNYGQNLAMTYAYNPYMSNLQSLSGQGLGAAGTSGQYAMTAGQNIGQDYMSAAQAQANAQIQAAQAEQQSSQGLWGNIMSGLGLVGGLALAPFTGGTSLLGAGMGALGSLGGGGGGGGGYGMTFPDMYAGAGSYNAYTPSGGGGWKLLAEGGPTKGGSAYVVGEKGPEVFVPQTDGYVVPNHAIPQNEFTAFAPWRGPSGPPMTEVPPRGWRGSMPWYDAGQV